MEAYQTPANVSWKNRQWMKHVPRRLDQPKKGSVGLSEKSERKTNSGRDGVSESIEEMELQSFRWLPCVVEPARGGCGLHSNE